MFIYHRLPVVTLFGEELLSSIHRFVQCPNMHGICPFSSLKGFPPSAAVQVFGTA